MSCILHIETSTQPCSVAVSQDGQVIYHIEDMNGPSHATELGSFVDQAASFADSHAIPLDAVAVSSGPGSYTGLRIGVSTAKGLCYSRNLKLLSIPTLKLLCVPLLLGREELPEDALLCPMIDARRMEVYTALYTRALKPVVDVQAMVVNEQSFESHLNEHPVYFFGNGSDKCKTMIQHPNARFISGVHPLAKYMMPLAERANAMEEFQDVAYFEPFYLKDFQATVPKPLL